MYCIVVVHLQFRILVCMYYVTITKDTGSLIVEAALSLISGTYEDFVLKY